MNRLFKGDDNGSPAHRQSMVHDNYDDDDGKKKENGGDRLSSVIVNFSHSDYLQNQCIFVRLDNSNLKACGIPTTKHAAARLT